jgi:asparagine synthase (glutamine-hydrolysing)
MCGIFGVLSLDKTNSPSEEIAYQALKKMQHRGPDALIVSKITDQLVFGHARLSILDLGEQSNQPFDYEHLSIVFNGEIYNYIELREELLKMGFSFRTQGDTEVVLAAYLAWGENCLSRFNGMWAFAIFDKKSGALFCSRDRFGVKPFLYHRSESELIFSSEAKSIIAYKPSLAKPNYNSISRYLRETIGAQAEETWFEGIHRLPPAHNMRIDRDGNFEISRYWNYPSKIQESRTLENTLDEYSSLFENAVSLRMRSDVPVGLTLSGGLDSASIAGVVRKNSSQKLKAYTASFPGQPFDEYGIARQLCEQLDFESIEVPVPYDDYTDTLNKIVWHLESGHGSPAIFPLWHVAMRARQDIVVFLEGQGADELLGGYINTVFFDRFLDLLLDGKMEEAFREIMLHRKHWPLAASLLLHLRLELPPVVREWFRTYNGYESLFIGQLQGHRPFSEAHLGLERFESKLSRKTALLHQTGLVNLLHYGDAVSMAHSLENRLPFLDYRLVELAFSLPDQLKVHNGLGKFIHRKYAEGIIPNSITGNFKKLGFVSPLKQVFEQEKFGAIDVLRSEKLKNRRIIDGKKLDSLIEEHRAGKKNHERILFKILSTELWFRNFIDG